MPDGLQDTDRRQQAPVIGITGNIGTGKSTVTKILAERGVHVIDADHVVHALYADPNSALVEAVAAKFGGSILAQDGTLDRAALGKLVFGDTSALGRLESLVHPAVVAEVQKVLDGISLQTPCAIEAIKLIESDLVTMLDAVWIVVATPELQLARLFVKGMSPDEAQRRIDMQTSFEEKIAHLRQKRAASCPAIRIKNTGTLANLESNAYEAWETTKTMSRATKES